jgi:DNA-binding transcriptional MerR regulator
VNPVALNSADITEATWTAAEAAQAVGVKVYTIWQWKRRGHLQPAGLNDTGLQVFRVLDVARAEYATRQRARRSFPQAA